MAAGTPGTGHCRCAPAGRGPAVAGWSMNGGWPAPAKLNLFLHVVGRRADGYHELQTVFRIVDLADDLRFTTRDDPLVRRVGPDRNRCLPRTT